MSEIPTMVLQKQIKELQDQLSEGRQQLTALRRKLPPEEVEDYVFAGPEGATVRLSELFGDKDELLVVHNMGRNCQYCTLWADGFNGLLPHLEDRAAFVVISPDEPAEQRKFAQSRNWRFQMYSGHGNSFAADMGFESENGKPWPGISAFKKQADGRIVRTGRDEFGPGDYYCPIWHMMDLLPALEDAWSPKFSYSKQAT